MFRLVKILFPLGAVFKHFMAEGSLDRRAEDKRDRHQFRNILLQASFLVSAKLVLFAHTMNFSTEGGTASSAAVHRLPRSQGIAYISAFIVEALFIMIGNLVVLAVFGKNRQLRHKGNLTGFSSTRRWLICSPGS